MSRRSRKSSGTSQPPMKLECGHESESEAGGPCSRCKPPESWVAKGMIPKTWKHMPWDDVELKKHGNLRNKDNDESDFDDRHLPSIEEDMKRSTKIGEDESSAELENWPRVEITGEIGRRVSSTASVSVAEDEGEGPEPRAVRRKRPSKRRGRSKASKIRKAPSTRKRCKTQKVFIPLKKSKRGKSMNITFNILVKVKKRTSE